MPNPITNRRLGGNSLLTGLIAYWALSDLTDSVGGNTLTNNNGTTFVAGKVGACASFAAASSQSLSVADNPSLSAGNVNYTIACWVKFTSLSGERPFVCKGGNAALTEYELYGTLTRIQFDWYTTAGGGNAKTVAANSFGAIATGTWYHVVCWHDASANTVNISVNNGTVDSATAIGGWDSASVFSLGARSTVVHDGQIDEVGIWKRLLTPAERTQLYNGGNGLTYPFG